MRDKVSKINEVHEYVKDFGSVIVGVDKVGGGTVGREYQGGWAATLYDYSGRPLEVDISVGTGVLHSHEWVAEFVFGDLSTEQMFGPYCFDCNDHHR